METYRGSWSVWPCFDELPVIIWPVDVFSPPPCMDTNKDDGKRRERV